jgi:hypothetical protein
VKLLLTLCVGKPGGSEAERVTRTVLFVIHASDRYNGLSPEFRARFLAGVRLFVASSSLLPTFRA